MKFLYQGTAAAEGIPALFCQCDVCARAMKAGGSEIRTRSGALVDGRLKLDFGPDSYIHMLKSGASFADIHSVLITHTHDDHFAHAQLGLRRDAFACYSTQSPLMTVYGNAKTCELLANSGKNENLRLRVLEPFKPVEIDGYTVTPLDAVHCLSGGNRYPVKHRGKTYFRSEQAFIYLIEKKGKKLLYAHDTDEFTDDVMTALAGKHIDFISLDCTNGIADVAYAGHMGCRQNLVLRERLLLNGAADDHTMFAASHFSHSGYTNCADMRGRLPGFVIACDGLEIEF